MYLVVLIVPTGTWHDTSNVTGIYELVKVQQNTQHGKARRSTALRSAELALRCAAELSCRAPQGTALHGAALRSYSAAVGCWAEL